METAVGDLIDYEDPMTRKPCKAEVLKVHDDGTCDIRYPHPFAEGVMTEAERYRPPASRGEPTNTVRDEQWREIRAFAPETGEQRVEGATVRHKVEVTKGAR